MASVSVPHTDLAQFGPWRAEPPRIRVGAAEARHYARIAFRFLQDCWRHETWDPEAPVHVLELGATSAMLGRGLLHHLRALVMRYPYSLPSFRYVLCASDADRVKAWNGRSDLAPWLESGVLDLAVFDDRSDVLRLHRCGEELRPGSADNPTLVLAHRVFSRWPQQAFRVREGRAVQLAIGDAPVDTPRGRLHQVLEVDEPTTDDLDLVLSVAARRLHEADFTVPVGALRCLDAVSELCHGRLVAIATDDGTAELADLEGQRIDAVDPWQNPRLPINAGVLAELLNPRSATTFAAGVGAERVTAAIVFGRPSEFVETVAAWSQELVEEWAIDVPDPDPTGLDLAQLVGLLRVGAWCPMLFARVTPAILDAIGGATEPERRQLAAGLPEVQAQILAEHVDFDVHYAIGRVWFALGSPELADAAWATSQAEHGPSIPRLVNRALCAEVTGQLDLAHGRLTEALALDPGDAVARSGLERIANARQEAR